MSSRQALRDLNTYWETINATRKKCKKSGKTYESPDSIKRVECIVDTLNSVARNNSPRIHIIGTKKPILRGRKYTPEEQADFNAFHKRVDDEEAAATATARNENNNNSPASPAASPTSARDALASAASNNTNDEANDEKEGNSFRAPAAARSSALPSARAAARAAARSSALPSARAAARSSALPSARAAARSSALPSARAAARSYATRSFSHPSLSKMTVEQKFTNVQDQEAINKIILETIFKNDQREKNKYIIELNDMRDDPSRYLIFFQTSTSLSRDYNGHRYKLFKNGNKFVLETQDTPSTSKGGRRRKTQKKNKHKKRTTSKRR